MKIFKRFAESISSPSSMAWGVNDKAITTILYTILLIIIMIMPYVINSFSLYDLNYESKLELRNAFFKEEISFKIEDGKLINYGNDEYYYNNNIDDRYEIYIASSDKVNKETQSILDYTSYMTETIALLEDGVYLYNGITYNKLFYYSDYAELSNLDLNEAGKDNLSFWDSVFKVLQIQLKRVKPMYIFIYILSSILQACVNIVLCSLVLTGFNRIGKVLTLKFIDHWKLNIYGSTGFILGNALSILYNSMLLYYVGLFISIIMCSLASKKFIRRGGTNEL